MKLSITPSWGHRWKIPNQNGFFPGITSNAEAIITPATASLYAAAFLILIKCIDRFG